MRRRTRDHTGSVTAELALALPSLLLILAIGIWLQSAVALQARCLDAARAGARAVARGDSDAVVRSTISAGLPTGSSVAIDHAGGLVAVKVRAPARPPAGLAEFVGMPTVTGLATAVDEAAATPWSE